MKRTAICLGLVLILNGCVQYGFTGKHVPISGPQTADEKIVLAKNVLAALPPEQVYSLIQKRFPQLAAKDLKHITFDYRTMNFYDNGFDNPPRTEVHLVVSVYHAKALQPIAGEIEAFVSTLFHEELQRQIELAPN